MAAGIHGDRCNTTVSAADATLKSVAGHIHWITISNNHATDEVDVELQDGTTDVWAVAVEAIDHTQPVHFVFDPPIYCATDIRVDITNGTPLVTVGWT